MLKEGLGGSWALGRPTLYLNQEESYGVQGTVRPGQLHSSTLARWMSPASFFMYAVHSGRMNLIVEAVQVLTYSVHTLLGLYQVVNEKDCSAGKNSSWRAEMRVE